MNYRMLRTISSGSINVIQRVVRRHLLILDYGPIFTYRTKVGTITIVPYGYQSQRRRDTYRRSVSPCSTRLCLLVLAQCGFDGTGLRFVTQGARGGSLRGACGLRLPMQR